LRKSTVILRKGDLSAPVLAIVVTIGLIAAGLVLLAWFFWFAPQASKTGALQIIGQPVVILNKTKGSAAYYPINVTVSVKNVGSTSITITKIIVANITFDLSAKNIVLQPGDSKDITAGVSVTKHPDWKYTVDGVIITDSGTYPTSFTVIKT
jgi:hypothetical protein